MTQGAKHRERERLAAEAARAAVGGEPRRPMPPSQLSDAERAIWTKVCKDQSHEWCEVAKAGRMLQMYCVAVAFYDACLAGMRAELVEADPATYLPVATRWQKTLADLEPRIYTLETKLRLTPQSRQRADGPQGAPPRNPWDPPGDEGETD